MDKVWGQVKSAINTQGRNLKFQKLLASKLRNLTGRSEPALTDE